MTGKKLSQYDQCSRLVNTSSASFNFITRQMTEMSEGKKTGQIKHLADRCEMQPTLYARAGQTCFLYELHIVKPKLQRAAT